MAKPTYSAAFDPANNPFLNPETNPFLDPTKNPFLNADLTKLFVAPPVNPNAVADLADVQRQNFEALSEAGRTAFEGLQSVYARQGEIMKELMEETVAAAQEMSAAGAPEDQIASRIDQVKDVMQQSVSNIREISEMIAKSQGEAFEILNQRAAANLEELKSAVRPTKG